MPPSTCERVLHCLPAIQEIEAIKARVKEMEEEAEKLKEMQTEVEKQMSTKSGEILSSLGEPCLPLLPVAISFTVSHT